MKELQWSPVLETGNTPALALEQGGVALAAMEPGLRDREYRSTRSAPDGQRAAAMEPGLRDREYSPRRRCSRILTALQWSPVLETGNTRPLEPHPRLGPIAAMEPGFRDREYLQ